MCVEPLTLLGYLAKPAIESLLTRILKPSNIKARLNTMEAYCIYYPIYKSIQCLGNYDEKLIEELVASLKEDPVLFIRLLPHIGSIGPSKPSLDTEAKELFKKNSTLLYLPEPFLKELEKVKDEIDKISSSIEKKDLKSALEVAEKNFKDKYEKGDIQIPRIEEVIEEILILLTSIIMLGRKPNYITAKAVINSYYVILVFERSLEQLPAIFMIIMSLFMPPETLSISLERLEKIKEVFPSGQKLMMISYIEQSLQIGASILGFKYEEFKNAFEKAERLLRYSEMHSSYTYNS
jgi:hypothetical protein